MLLAPVAAPVVTAELSGFANPIMVPVVEKGIEAVGGATVAYGGNDLLETVTGLNPIKEGYKLVTDDYEELYQETENLLVTLDSYFIFSGVVGGITSKNNQSFNEGSQETEHFKAPEINVDNKGNLTNGKYTLDQKGMQVHVDGKNISKSQFLYDVDANKAVLDAAAYADENNLWVPNTGNPTDFANKAKVYVENGPVGVTGSGELTNYINIYRTKTGYVHGSPGNP